MAFYLQFGAIGKGKLHVVFLSHKHIALWCNIRMISSINVWLLANQQGHESIRCLLIL